jgi:hypothetical protein
MLIRRRQLRSKMEKLLETLTLGGIKAEFVDVIVLTVWTERMTLNRESEFTLSHIRYVLTVIC